MALDNAIFTGVTEQLFRIKTMSESFLIPFMQAAQSITNAERGMAVDTELEVLATINLSDTDLQDRAFNESAVNALTQAMDKGEPIITNNLIVDPAQAPNTNTSLANLRFVVGIPVPEIGAVYLDQRIRTGALISQEIVQNLMELVKHIQANQLENSTVEAMFEIYRQIF